MNRPPTPAPPHTLALARQAASLEARGAFTEAAAVWARAAASDGAFLPAQLGLAQAHIRTGRPADALPVLDRLRAQAPGLPAAWLATAVAQSMLGRHDDAVEHARRAVALAPAVPAAHLGLGDVLRQAGRLEAASDAYRHAVALAPDDPEANAKAAVIARLARRLDDAEAMLRKALARAPGHPYAQVNLATLLLERGRIEEGEAMLDAASATANLPPDARSEIADARSMLAERASLAAPLAAARSSDDPAPLIAGLRALRRPDTIDRALVDDLERIASGLAASDGSGASFASGAPASSAWFAIEAHHNVLPTRDAGAIARSVSLFAHPERRSGDADLDVLAYARAVASATSSPPDDRDPIALEGWLRLRHAQIVAHRPEIGPGMVKLINNVVGTAVHVPRTAPGQIAATLEAVVEIASRVPGGAPRAVFLYMALLEMHVFADANGRVVRLALNRWLASAGSFPYLRAAESEARLLARARASGDLRPVIECIGGGSRYAAELDRDWAAREAATRS